MKKQDFYTSDVFLANKELMKELVNDSNQESIYVINEDYTILKTNEEFEKNYPNVKVGDVCYKALRGLVEPCSYCLRRKTGVNRHTVSGTCSDDRLNRNCNFKMSPIVWNRTESAFLIRLTETPVTEAERIKKKENEDIVKAFADKYYSCVLVDFENNTYKLLSGKRIVKKAAGSFSEDFVQDIALRVHRDDVVEFTQFLMINSAPEYEGPNAERKDNAVDFRLIDSRQKYNWSKVVKFALTDDYQTFILAFEDTRFEKQKEMDYIYKLRDALRVANVAVDIKSVFLSNIASEIRTPMNSVMGMIQIARKNSDDKEKVAECLDKVEESTQTLLSLMSDILEMSKLETGKYLLLNEEFSMNALVKAVKENMQEKAWKSRIDFNIDTTLLDYDKFIGDGNKLAQVVTNLIDNAIKNTPANGTVDFLVNVTQVMGDNVGIRFEVIDTGVGLSENEIQALFNPLNKPIVESGKSVGLGIAIAKNIIHMMNGDIRIESKKGKGTTATVDILLKVAETKEEPKKRPRKVPINTPKDLKGKRVLIVEDNPINLEVAVEILKSKGLIIETAINGKEAVEQFEASDEGYFDAIIMDIQMPIMNGYEASKAIRMSYHPDGKKIPIIATTAMTFDEDIAKAKLSGMNAHLAKPVDFNRLCSVISDFI